MGVSHLSLVYASVFAKHAAKTLVFGAIDSDVIDGLRSREVSIKEPGLERRFFPAKIKFFSLT